MPQDSEELLIQRAQGGAVGAWEQLIARYQSGLHDHIRRRYPQSLAAFLSTEDILQDVLLQAWLNIGSLKRTAPATFVSWLHAIADRRVGDALKAQQRRKRGGGVHRVIRRGAEWADSWDDLLDALPADAKTASSILSRQETARALEVAVSLLPDAQQAALRMHYLEGRTIDETARQLQRTAPAVRGLLHRGKERLAEQLGTASSWLGARSQVTRLLAEIASGNDHAAGAAEELLPLVYEELRKLAADKLRREEPGQTLQATALVHEAYIRLVDTVRTTEWQGHGHFFAAAAEAMRRIVVERARRKRRPKHGGDRRRVDLDEACCVTREPPDEVLAVSEALDRFAKVAPQKAELVKLRYFAGMTVPEAARVLGISHATAERYWAYARVWLYSEIRGQ